MVNPIVERATSDNLVGPDWSINIGVCDICNRDPSQAKDVVKAIKKRLGSKNTKVQLLTLTLLETIVKNCRDFVHMHVAEKDLLRDMVKIVKKKPDFTVKEKILILIDTWQEAFGGARARYPQYYAAYQELLRMGITFPKRTERSAPVFTPPQTHPLMRNPENGNEAAGSSAEAEFPTLSLTEIQNARGIIDVLAEMLTAIDPETKEGLRQEVVIDLVQQCRTYKQRVVHLVNSTSDESLLCQGLALNDDLQRVLAKHEALISGPSVSSEKLKPKSSKAFVPVDASIVDTEESKKPGSLAPVTTNAPSTPPPKVNPTFDLLSFDDITSPVVENSLAIVPVGEPHSDTHVSQQNALALVDRSQNNSPAGQTYSSSSSPQFKQPQHFPPQQHSFNPNGTVPNMVPPQYEPTFSASPNFQHFPAQQPSFNPNVNMTSLYAQGSNSSPQCQQSQHFPAHQRSFSNPNGTVPNMVPPYYDPMSLYTQGSSPAAGQTNSSSPQVQQSQHFPSQPPSPNGSLPNMVPSQHEPTSPYAQGSSPAWSGHMSQQQQPSSPVYGSQTSSGGLPPPPWESPPPDTNSYPQILGNNNNNNNNNPAMGVYMKQQITGGPQPMNHHTILPQQQFMGMLPPHQVTYIYPQQIPQQIYNDPMAQAYGYGYRQPQSVQFLDHRMSGMSVREDGFMNNTLYTAPSMTNASYVHMPSGNPSKPEEKFFGDLVEFNKVKPNKSMGLY